MSDSLHGDVHRWLGMWKKNTYLITTLVDNVSSMMVQVTGVSAQQIILSYI